MPCINCGGSSTPTGAVHEAKIETPGNTQVRSWTALPLLDETNVPEDLDLIGGSNSEYKAWRIPLRYINPSGSVNKVQYSVDDVTELNIPTGQVVPVYSVHDEGRGAIVLEKAKAAVKQTATDIAVFTHDGQVVVMKNGYYTFNRPHMYEVGQTYYLSQSVPGEVVSTRPSAGIIQPLFSVIDLNTISINVNLY